MFFHGEIEVQLKGIKMFFFLAANIYKKCYLFPNALAILDDIYVTVGITSLYICGKLSMISCIDDHLDQL